MREHLRKKHPIIGPKQWNQMRNSLCVKCNKTFETPDGLKAHRQKAHTVFKCDICDKSMITELSLNHHRSLHSSKERNYKCNVSGDFFCYSN